MSVEVGTNPNTGIKINRTPTWTNRKRQVALVDTTGKNSFLKFKDLRIALLSLKLVSPPIVPRENNWKSITPTMR